MHFPQNSIFPKDQKMNRYRMGVSTNMTTDSTWHNNGCCDRSPSPDLASVNV